MTRSALDPDQVASAVGSDDVETTMTEWARATRLLDALRSVERGKSPSVDVETETTYDAAELFGPDAIDYLARELSAEREGSTFSVARVIATYDQLEEAFLMDDDTIAYTDDLEELVEQLREIRAAFPEMRAWAGAGAATARRRAREWASD